MEKQMNVGIIGTGGVGEVLLRAFQKSSLTNVIGINDNNAERAKEISDKYQIPVYENYQDMIHSNAFDLIYVAVPPKYHHRIALDVIKAKKHIFCEKPLANSLREAEEMALAAEQNGVVTAVNFPTIYGPAFKALQNHLAEGKLGDLLRVELNCYFATWPRAWQQNSWIHTREQGGFIREVFPHYLNILQKLFGTITITSSNVEYPKQQELCETSIIATAHLEDGTPVLLNGISNVGMEEELDFTLYGTNGVVSLVNWSQLWTSTRGGSLAKVELPTEDSLQNIIADVVNAVKGKPSTVVSFMEGMKVQENLEQLLHFQK